MLKSSGWKIAFGSVCVMATAYLALRKSRTAGFRDCSVIITGGSRGLGLELARRFVLEGARIALLARDAEKLEKAHQMLGGTRAILPVPCDLRSPGQIEVAVREVAGAFGGVDVLINCAGIIQAGPFESMEVEDFEEAMDVHLWAPLHLTAAVLPYLERSRFPRIVNICSIGGKISVPHLLPYCTSKFALAGFSEGLRSALGHKGIPVTTVYPGLMRTGSHINALFRGKQKLEYAWFSLGAAAPLISIDSGTAAEKIVHAARKGQANLMYPLATRAADLKKTLSPNLFAMILRIVNRLLPGPPQEDTGLRRGKDCQSWISPSPLTMLADRASRRNNEL